MRRLILTLLPLALPLYVVRFHLGPFPTTVLEVVLIFCLAAWTATRKTDGWKNAFHILKARGWAWPLAAWLAVGLISCIVAPNHLTALGLWRAYFLEPILVFAMLTDLVQTEEDVRCLLYSTIAVITVCAFWAVFQFSTHIGIPNPWNAPPSGIRATGPFPFPNAVALFAAPIAALCFASIVDGRQQQGSYRLPSTVYRLLPWLGFASGMICIALAKSVGGAIGLGTAMFVVLVMQKRWRAPVIVATLIGAAIAMALPTTRHLITDQLFFHEWSGRVRLVIWQETAAMLKDHPVFGAGLGAYPTVILPYHTAHWMEVFQYPHNILLNLWSETGLLGIIVFGWICMTWLKQRSVKSTLIYTLPVLTAIVIHGLVDVPYFKNDLAVLFWILVTITVASTEIQTPINT